MKLKLIAIALVVLSGGVTLAQTPDPSTLPLLTEASLRYVGAFRPPSTRSNNETFHGGGMGVAFNPANNSLFVTSYGNEPDYTIKVAEITIPEPVNSANRLDLPQATFVQGFHDPTEGRTKEATFGYGGGISGILVANGRLYGSAQIYYDSGNDQRVSHYSRSLKLDDPSFVGWASVWQADKTGYVSGFMSLIPPAWQARLGGSVATGQCCIPVVYRTSFGPSAFAFDPTTIARGALVSASPLLYYDGAHQTLGEYTNVSTPNPVYNQSTEIHGFVIVEGTRTALYFGRSGTGVPCYGKGTGDTAKVGTFDPVDGALYCYDLDQFGKGVHAWPYRHQIWAYDLNDFAAVKAGTKQPWDVRPYGVWPLNLPTPGTEVRLGGVGYDPKRQRVYISQLMADRAGDYYGPILHAIDMNVSPAPVPTPIPTPNPTPTPNVDPKIAELEQRIRAMKAEAEYVLHRNATLRPNSKLPAWVTDALSRIVAK